MLPSGRAVAATEADPAVAVIGAGPTGAVAVSGVGASADGSLS